MEVILMNRHVPILRMDMDVTQGYIHGVTRMENPEYLPIGVLDEWGALSIKRLSAWWKGRAIPASRDGLRNALESLGVESALELAGKSLGLSLSDQYWICPAGKRLSWDEVNFFQNPFSEDVGNAFFRASARKAIDLVSPDNTSDGWLKKKWIVKNGKRCLLKSGSKPFYQEPFNEAIASRLLADANGVSFVPYELFEIEGMTVSLCENFITPETEFVPAYAVYQAIKREGADDPWTCLHRGAEKLEIPGVEKFLDRMLTLDYLILNTDRHMGNFGFIRNVETLRFEGPAPLFDQGTSLWTNELGISVHHDPSKPFRGHHKKQIKLVKDTGGFSPDALRKIPVEKILMQNPRIDQRRAEAIGNGFLARIREWERVRQSAWRR